MKTVGLSLDQAPPEDIPIRFFLTAPLFGSLAGCLMLYQGQQLFLSEWLLETVAFTHLLTLGWLAMIMIGASYQMILVLVGGKVPFLSLSRFVHLGLAGGILGFAGGLINNHSTSFFASAIVLLGALSIFVIQISWSLFRVEANRPTVLAMRISILSLALTIILGGMLIGQIAGWWRVPFDRSLLKGIHLTLGLLGWVTCLVVGVGFHVIPMFYLARPFPVRTAWWIIYFLLLSLLLYPVVSFLALDTKWKMLAFLPAGVGLGMFLITLIDLFRKRRRKSVDTTLRFWQFGLLNLFFSLPICLVFIWNSKPALGFLGVLLVIGFALSVTNGMLYKIVPFLIWLHRFSPLLGKVRVPLMKDIVADASARRQWRVFVPAILLLAAGIVGQLDFLVRFAGGMWTAASWMLFIILYKASRMRPPEIR
ncbi:MAG: hypothetical protein HQM13_00875 [SAR324 cluster bacterium]|nr:hypothetical protein [SAR324 cluster bacterium]